MWVDMLCVSSGFPGGSDGVSPAETKIKFIAYFRKESFAGTQPLWGHIPFCIYDSSRVE